MQESTKYKLPFDEQTAIALLRARGVEVQADQLRTLAELEKNPAPAAAAATTAEESTPPNLVDLAESWSGTPIYYVTYTDTNGKTVRILQAQCSQSAWTCNQNQSEDWYFVEQYPLMSPPVLPPQGVTVNLPQYGPFTAYAVIQGEYVFQASTDPNALRSASSLFPGLPTLGTVGASNLPNANVFGTPSSPPAPSDLGVILEQPRPATSQGSTTYTSGVDWSLGGSIGFDSSGGSASVNGGVTVSNSTSVTIPDVSVVNNSATPLYSVKYTFNSGEQVASSFQTVDSFIFHMPTSQRGALPIGEDGEPYFPVYFRVSCAIGVLGRIGIFPVPYPEVFDLDYTLKLPLPPLSQ